MLYIYFHIDVRETVKSNIKLINNRVKLRDLFKKEFYKQFDPSKPAIGFHRFNCGKIIIRKHDYINNNENISDEFGWYSYFGGEPYEITDVGILLVIGLFKGYIKDSNFYKYEENKSIPKDIKLEKFYKFALLPYDNILTFDLNSGDGNPVMYCKYSGENGPFKEVYYDSVDRYKL